MKIEVFLKFFSNLIKYCVNKLIGIFESVFTRYVYSLVNYYLWLRAVLELHFKNASSQNGKRNLIYSFKSPVIRKMLFNKFINFCNMLYSSRNNKTGKGARLIFGIVLNPGEIKNIFNRRLTYIPGINTLERKNPSLFF